MLCVHLWAASPTVTVSGWVGRACPPVAGRDFREQVVSTLSLAGPAVIWFVSREQFDLVETLVNTLAAQPNPPKTVLVCDTSGIPFFIAWLVKGKIRERYEKMLRGAGFTLAADPKPGIPAPPEYPAYSVDDGDAAITKSFGDLARRLSDRLTGVMVNRQGVVTETFEKTPTAEEVVKALSSAQEHPFSPKDP